MAQLNVRERRLEACIAYVGPELSGKATNFARLGSGPVTGDDVLAIDWTPRAGLTFRDYEVTVKLVAPRGAPSKSTVQEVLHAADGVIFVADADPAAHERNLSSFAIFRDALANSRQRNVPVVIQVNKADLPDALSADEVMRALDVAWPHVSASATRGDGVVETVERAVANVLESLHASEALDASTGSGTEDPRPDGHPLLDALRQVLRDTVAESEVRSVAQMEAMLARVAAEARAARAADLQALQTTLVTELTKVRTSVQALDARLTEVQRVVGAVKTDLAAVADESRIAVATVDEAVRAVPTTLDQRFEELGAELSRTFDARSKAQREHVTSSLTPLKRTLDALGAELKAIDARPAIGELKSTLDAIQDHTVGLTKVAEPTLVAARAVDPRISKTEATLQRDVRDGLASVALRLEDRLELLRADAGEALAKSDATAHQAHELIKELIEELRKPKKGWFG